MKIEEIINLHDISPRKLAAKNLATKTVSYTHLTLPTTHYV